LLSLLIALAGHALRVAADAERQFEFRRAAIDDVISIAHAGIQQFRVFAVRAIKDRRQIAAANVILTQFDIGVILIVENVRRLQFIIAGAMPREREIRGIEAAAGAFVGDNGLIARFLCSEIRCLDLFFKRSISCCSALDLRSMLSGS